MLNSEPLVPFGLAVIAISFALIVIPYLRGKSDAITSWNLMLAGGAIFMGVGCLEVKYGNWLWPELQWFQPSRREVEKYMLAATSFYATIFITYYFFKWPRRFASKFFRKPPIQTTASTFFFVAFFLALMLCAILFRGVPIAGSFFLNVSHKAAVFATVFSFAYWYRNKKNVTILAGFLAIFAYSLLFAMVVFAGRRLLLSVAISPVIAMYWLGWRYRSPKLNLIYLGAAAFLALAVMAFYSTFRHSSLVSLTQERTFSSILRDMKASNVQKATEQVTKDWMHYLSQYTTHFSLLTIHLVDNGDAPTEPLNTLKFLATYPVPRLLFPGKPSAFGIRIVTDVLRLPYATNWGVGIVGHGYQEGGIAVIMLYGLLIVIVIRILDDSLVRQPNNVILISILCASSAHFVSWTRGDTFNMNAEIMESFAFAWAISLMGRFMFGTAAPVDGSYPSRPRPAQMGIALPHTGS